MLWSMPSCFEQRTHILRDIVGAGPAERVAMEGKFDMIELKARQYCAAATMRLRLTLVV